MVVWKTHTYHCHYTAVTHHAQGIGVAGLFPIVNSLVPQQFT